MSDFKAKMHQIRFRMGSAQTPLGELTVLPRPPSWIYGASKGKGGKGRKRNGREEEGGREEREKGEE